MANETAAASGTTRGRKSATRSKKTTTRKRTARRTRKTTAAATTTPATTTPRATATRPTRGGGSPRLADTLTGLLSEVTTEVQTVSTLSLAIDEAARALQERLADYTERMATMSRLR